MNWLFAGDARETKRINNCPTITNVNIQSFGKLLAPELEPCVLVRKKASACELCRVIVGRGKSLFLNILRLRNEDQG